MVASQKNDPEPVPATIAQKKDEKLKLDEKKVEKQPTF